MRVSVGCPRGDSPSFRCRTSLLICSFLLLGLSACSSGGDEATTRSTSESSTTTAPSASGAQADRSETRKATDPESPARERFISALQTLASKDNDPSREQIASAIKSAGFVSQDIEISNDTTPTGLDVDAMEAAVRVDGKCLVGQVRSGEATVASLPLLASGHCFVGDQR